MLFALRSARQHNSGFGVLYLTSLIWCVLRFDHVSPSYLADLEIGTRWQEEEAANNAAWKSPIMDFRDMADFELWGPTSHRIGKPDSDEEPDDAGEVPEDQVRGQVIPFRSPITCCSCTNCDCRYTTLKSDSHLNRSSAQQKQMRF